MPCDARSGRRVSRRARVRVIAELKREHDLIRVVTFATRPRLLEPVVSEDGTEQPPPIERHRVAADAPEDGALTPRRPSQLTSS